MTLGVAPAPLCSTVSINSHRPWTWRAFLLEMESDAYCGFPLGAHATRLKPLRCGGFGACHGLGRPMGRVGALITGAVGPARCAPESWAPSGRGMGACVPPLPAIVMDGGLAVCVRRF